MPINNSSMPSHFYIQGFVLLTVLFFSKFQESTKASVFAIFMVEMEDEIWGRG